MIKWNESNVGNISFEIRVIFVVQFSLYFFVFSFMLVHHFDFTHILKHKLNFQVVSSKISVINCLTYYVRKLNFVIIRQVSHLVWPYHIMNPKSTESHTHWQLIITGLTNCSVNSTFWGVTHQIVPWGHLCDFILVV